MPNSYVQGINQLSKSRGATLVELLATITIIVLLASLVLPGLSAAGARSTAVVCTSNIRQLQMLSLLYSGDNRDGLPLNLTQFDGAVWRSTKESWIGPNNAEIDDTPASTYGAFATLQGNESLLKILRCPSDKSTIGPMRRPRLRSYSLNVQLSGNKNLATNSQIGIVQKQSLIRNPANTFSFITEHQDTIDDGAFLLYAAPVDVWVNVPSSRHNRSDCIAKCDGSAISMKWITPKNARRQPSSSTSTAAYKARGVELTDLRWLQSQMIPAQSTLPE